MAVTQVTPRTPVVDPANGYALDSWQLGTKPDANQIHVSRLAYAGKTEINFGMTLSRILNRSWPDYGNIAVNVSNQSLPTSVLWNYLR